MRVITRTALRRCTLLFLLLLPGLAGQARNYPAPTPGDHLIKDFKFASGQSLPLVKIHYRTLGTPRKNTDGQTTHAVLITTLPTT